MRPHTSPAPTVEDQLHTGPPGRLETNDRKQRRMPAPALEHLVEKYSGRPQAPRLEPALRTENLDQPFGPAPRIQRCETEQLPAQLVETIERAGAIHPPKLACERQQQLVEWRLASARQGREGREAGDARDLRLGIDRLLHQLLRVRVA